MVYIAGFFTQVLKGAAVQLGVQAVIETAWPHMKKGVNRLVNKFSNRTEPAKESDLQTLVKESEKRANTEEQV